MRSASRHLFANILGVIYAHRKTPDGGDIYLTRHGLEYSNFLRVNNWYDKEWFQTHRTRLAGTSTVFRVQTKKVGGKSIQLVVKNCRVGEDVPLETHILKEFVAAEFNSPWEEFALVAEMRESTYGPTDISVKTQKPLAIYVPPKKLQLWQTGRSRWKINKIIKRHPGIHLDILKQYKLVYEWIEGLDIVEAFEEIGVERDVLDSLLAPLTEKTIADLNAKGYGVADMKPAHVIIHEQHIKKMRGTRAQTEAGKQQKQIRFISDLVQRGEYSVIDYELLGRTPEHEVEVKHGRRCSYLDNQLNRFKAEPLPAYFCQQNIFGVPYVHGHAESTDGLVWVVGRNARLFDYFLPERWRKTPTRVLSEHRDVYYTLTKDNVHLVWKTSRVGDRVLSDEGGEQNELLRELGLNSPFEEFSIAFWLGNNGIPCTYIRAIYMTGSAKVEGVMDESRFQSHSDLIAIDNLPVLRRERNYITIRGFYNGPDSWVAAQQGPLYEPFDLKIACEEGVLPYEDVNKLLAITRDRLSNVGVNGSFLDLNDIIIAIDSEQGIIKDKTGLPELRICNFEKLYRHDGNSFCADLNE